MVLPMSALLVGAGSVKKWLYKSSSEDGLLQFGF
jgi:hypothetical protein